MDEKLKSHFLNLFSFALSDNNVDVTEAEKLYNIALDKGVSRDEVNYLLDNPHKVKIIFPENINDIADQLYDIAQIILADGKIDIREITSLREFINIFAKNKDDNNKIIEALIDGVKQKVDREKLLTEIRTLLNR